MRKRWLLFAVALLVLFLAVRSYLRSASFAALVRAHVVADIERATGGRVEIGGSSWGWSGMQFEAWDLTVHGLEPGGSAPLLHVDHLIAHARLQSLFMPSIGLQLLRLERPAVHIILQPDGSSNLPAPKLSAANTDAVQQLIQMGLERLEVSDGELLLNERRIPIDLAVNDAALQLNYAPAQKSYSAELSAAHIESRYLADNAPLTSRLTASLRLEQRRASIESLDWQSMSSKLHLSGEVKDLAHPSFDLAYTVEASVSEIARALRVSQLHSGNVLANGKVSGTLDQYRVTGHARLTGGAFTDSAVTLRDVAGQADFSADPSTIILDHIAGAALGGRFTGSLRVLQWANKDRHGTVRLDLSSLSAASLAAAVSQPELPLSELRPAGSASGTLTSEWHGSMERADSTLRLDITSPSSPAPGTLPVSGTLDASYRSASRILQFAKLDLSTPQSHIVAGGAVGSTSTLLHVNFNTADPSELAAVCAPLLRNGNSSAELRGPLQFIGDVSGRISQPAMHGHLAMRDFDVTLTLPSLAVQPAAPHPFQSHWDTLTTDLLYSSSSLALTNATAQSGAARIKGSMSTAMRRGRPMPDSVFSFAAQFEQLPLAQLQSAAGTNYPVSGTASGALSGGGTLNDLHAQGKVQLAPVSIYGEPVRFASADVDLSSSRAQFTNIVVSQNGGQVTGRASVGLHDRSFAFTLEGKGLELAHFSELQQRFNVDVSGMADFHAEGHGTLDEPQLNATLSARSLRAVGEDVGDLTATILTHGEELQLQAETRIGESLLRTSGTVQLRDGWPADLRTSFRDVDVDPLLKYYLHAKLSGHSAVNGHLDIHGPLRSPRGLAVNGVLSSVRVEVEQVSLRNTAPVQFSINSAVLRVESLKIAGEGTDFAMQGTAQLTGNRALDFTGTGSLNLHVLQLADPDLISSGSARVSLHAGGTMQAPALAGNVDVAHGAFAIAGVPNGLSDVNGTLVFNQNQLQVQSLTARTGGGDLRLGGFLAYRSGISFDLTAIGSGIRLRYPPGVSSTADVDLRLSGNTKAALLSGDVTVTRFGITPQFDFALYIARAKQTSSTINTNTFQDALKLDVHVVSVPELQVQTSLAKLSGDVDLHIRGTVARPSLLGRVNVVEGDVIFNGTKFHVERGDISFTNPVHIEPVLDVEATARVRDYDLTLGFHGSMDKLSTTYRSEPPLPPADIVALLAFGRTREETQLQNATTYQNVTPLSEGAQNALLGEALNATISSRVQRIFGVSRVKIDPQVGEAGNPNARVTIEQQVSKNVTLTYITNLSQSAQQVIQAEINFTRELSLVAVRDYDGVLSFEFHIRKRKK